MTPIKTVKRARSLRREMSLPEVLLWRVLRSRPNSLNFRRQFPVQSHIADLACPEARLLVEIDGEAHSRGVRPERDAIRDAALTTAGYSVVRIGATEVLRDVETVVVAIVVACGEVGPLHHPAAPDGPPPRSGEEKEAA